MSQSSESVLRELQLRGTQVICIAVSAEYLIWCSHSGGVSKLYVWYCWEEQPSTEPLVELGFTPSLISLFQEKILLIGERALALFTLERHPLCILAGGGVEEQEEEEECSLTEEFVCGCVIEGVNQATWTPDGLTVALSTPDQLVLVDCRVGYTGNGDDSGSRGGERWPYQLVDCGCWYDDHGAAFAAFSATRLFLISYQNHLVSIRYKNEDDDICCHVESILDRDGHILSRAHQVTCFAVGGSEEGHLVVGFSDGTVKLLQQETLDVFFTLNVTKQLYRSVDPSTIPKEVEEGGMCVLDVTVGRKFFLLVRPDAVICYDKNSMELLIDRTLFLSDDNSVLCAVSGNGSWCVWSPKKQDFIYYVPGVEVCSSNINNDDMIHAREALRAELLEPLLLPYQQQLAAATAASVGKGTGKNDKNNKKKTNLNVDKPVTFGHPIKSSGYAASVPWSIQKQEKDIRAKTRKPTRLPPITAAPLRYKALPFSNHPLQPMTNSNKILSSSPIHHAVVTSATFSAAGAGLLTASGDTTANWLKYPVAKNGGDGKMMRAHKAPLNTADINLSVNAPIVATGSADGMIAVWQPSKRASPYIIQQVGKEVRSVKFFYTDKFLCYAAGNTVNLSRYALDDGGGDLHRKRNESKMENVLSFNAGSAHSVVAIDAINYFTSNIIVWAGSNKTVGIYDVSAEKNIRLVEEAHTRPIHHIGMMTASRYASPSTDLLHMYITAGLDNTVRVWDLRQERSVRQLAFHRNTAVPVGVALSPTGAMVAVGSENRTVCIYDVGSGAALDNVVVADIPTAVCWHPVENVLAVGITTGGIHLMGQR
ncbi:putative WD repeat-containing protein 27-like [Trypanosoma theileri]|uniref:Putative WD repeat-containing protein 27-like n=1 Tax=Trypanosoma theileri TaxID=67003 RepID=A0A1X0P1Y6_9TRYP|nr:putative WD repeat-containing protein 27-like [Trypanosoma theileri]ORC90861.1 putative WD repeat-containing protein 27-like [Trypanosoma theileri]